MAFQRISKNGDDGDQFKFTEEGAELVGYYLGMTLIPIKGKDVPRYSFKTSEGVKTVLGSMNLNEGMESAVQGAMTRVVYQELKKTKAGNSFKQFAVDQDLEDILSEPLPATKTPPSAASTQASQAAARSATVANKAAELKGQLNKTVS